MLQSRLNLFLCLFSILAGSTAEAVQRDLPYFVDVAGAELDLEQEARTAATISQLRGEKQLGAIVRANVRRLDRWRIFLRSDGTWVRDPLETNGEKYGDRFYPVEYVLPLGYRGAFQVAWGVPAAPPLQIVNGKIEIYIRASGVVETSSAAPLDNGTVVGIESRFYFEHDGERNAIPVDNPRERNGQVTIIRGPTRCPGIDQRCESYFVGTWADWRTITSTKCRTTEEEVQVITSGQNCDDVPPGSTQPVSDLVQPQGEAAVVSGEFHGRTINGRRVVLSGNSSGVNSWRYDGPESGAPDQSTLNSELKKYIETLLAAPPNVQVEQPGCEQEQMASLLRLAASGPYQFTRPPFNNSIRAAFPAHGEPGCKKCPSIAFFRRDDGWKLAACDDTAGIKWSDTGGSRFVGIAALLFAQRPESESISGFIGTPSFQNSVAVFLREDGSWDFADADYSDWRGTYTGYDMNGSQLALEIDAQGLRTWWIVSGKALHVHVEVVSSGLNQALDQFTELLSSGKIEEFLAHGAWDTEAYKVYLMLKFCAEKTADASADDGCDWFKHDPKHNFKTMARETLESLIHQVDVPNALEELKRLRSATPRISPVVLSSDFEALYTLPPKEPGLSQTIKRMIGHGSIWYFEQTSRE